ncbi:hypothetical protein M8J76_003806 [Diaphorina citri]|nr:hypothetical protein M8J75_015838 [Diaphorina citri]KAI5748984.1 hypothetical protein M8J76_003806 [Diaphorina citri]KAI5753560.1 hypothetical protein M8J77_001355 [Diaphorina citri]
MNIRCQLYVCVIVLSNGVLCFRSGRSYKASPGGHSYELPLSPDLETAANNYFKINYYYSSLPNQGPYAEVVQDKDPPAMLPIYHWKVLKSGISEHKRTVGTEFLGKRSEIVEDIDFDDPSIQKPCNRKNCPDK